MNSGTDDERFRHGAQKYDEYLKTQEGRLRSDLTFANLREFLPGLSGAKPRAVLDIGCGTGTMAVRLAQLGFHVTALDSSEAMLDLARRRAEEAEVTDRVVLRLGDAQRLEEGFAGANFDVVLCHNVLEYVGEPEEVLYSAARMLRDNAAILSVVVRNRLGEVFKAAIQAGDLAAAEANLTAEWGFESLYGGSVRLFSFPALQTLLDAASLTTIATKGVRVLADYLPSQVSRSSEYERILELERKLGSRPELAAVARYAHCLAQRLESDV